MITYLVIGQIYIIERLSHVFLRVNYPWFLSPKIFDVENL